MTWNEKPQPYPPGKYVFFTDDDGVKYGKVVQIEINITDSGKTTTWHIATQNRQGDGNIETIIYHKELKEIALDWENILEKAKANIFSYRIAYQEQEKSKEYAF